MTTVEQESVEHDATEDKAKVISFINLKGGVGKTSTAINIANSFAEKTYDVLVIDMDPQFNATQALLNHQFRYHRDYIDPELLKKVSEELNEKYQESNLPNNELVGEEHEEATPDEFFLKELSSQLVYKALKDNRTTVRSLFTQEGLIDPPQNPSLVYKIKDHLDIIPGDLALFESLYGDTSGKHNVLEDHFQSYDLRKQYDFILIDCPPNWTILTQASLFASDYYIIPSKVDLFSSVGIGLLNKLVQSTFYEKKAPINKMYSMYRRDLERNQIVSLGVLFTLTHDMQIASKLKVRLKKRIPQSFFEAEIPYHSSVPLKFSLYEESGSKHEGLKNSVSRVVSEIIGKIQVLEDSHEDS